MARARTAKHPPSPPSEPQSEPFQLEAANDNGQPEPKKADMVRAALAEGVTTPPEGVAWIKARYGIDLPKPMWSSYVAGFKRREGGQPTRTRNAAQQPAAIPAGFTGDIAHLRQLIAKAGGKEQLLEILNGPLPTLASKYGQGGLLELIEAIG